VLAPPRTPVQFITRWTYNDPLRLLSEFDFTMAQAVVWFDKGRGTFTSACALTYYADLAAKRLRYTEPTRDEDAGGSTMRMLKFAKRGWSIAPEDLARVLSRMSAQIRPGAGITDHATIFSSLLRQVDPLVILDGLDLDDEAEGDFA